MSKPIYRTIVCATDFSPASDVAVEHAATLAGATGAALHLVHVVQDPTQQPWTPEAYALNLGDLTREWIRAAQATLARVATATAMQPATACLVGKPAFEILQYVREHGADLLVIGSHGHGALAQLLLGGVAERLVRQARCPVLVARTPAAASALFAHASSAGDAEPFEPARRPMA